MSRKYELMEHPNGQYWKIRDSNTGKEYAKQEAVDMLNDIDEAYYTFLEIIVELQKEHREQRRTIREQEKNLSNIKKSLNEPIFTADTSRVWDSDADFTLNRWTFHELIMRQQDSIDELEQALYDVESELEELEQENRRLKELLKSNANSKGLY